MKKILLAFALSMSTLAHAGENKLCLNEVGFAAYKYAETELQTDSDRLFESMSSAVSSVKVAGGIMNNTIYSVNLSGRKVLPSGMIYGPASFTVTVAADADCKIDSVK